MELFSKGNPHKGVPDKHKRDKGEKDVSTNPALVTDCLIDHPKSTEIRGKAKAHQENNETKILNQHWSDPSAEEQNEIQAHGNEPS